MILLTFLYGASALVLDAIVGISIEVLLLDVHFERVGLPRFIGRPAKIGKSFARPFLHEVLPLVVVVGGLEIHRVDEAHSIAERRPPRIAHSLEGEDGGAEGVAIIIVVVTADPTPKAVSLDVHSSYNSIIYAFIDARSKA